MASRDPGDLHEWQPPRSWILGVLLCPGDDVRPIIRWLQEVSGDPHRVWFFLHPNTDVQILRPWAEAGFPTDQVDIVEGWERLHKLFGLALNDQVDADWKRLE